MDPVSEIVSVLGEETVRSLVRRFYERVKRDDLIGPMYPVSDWEGAEKRLGDFLVYRFGGAPTYLQERGHPRLRARHFEFSIGDGERDRWLELMGASMLELQLPEREAALMWAFFVQVADAMRNRAM